MSIEAKRLDPDAWSCSNARRHRNEPQPVSAILRISVDDVSHDLCERCAMDVFNGVGFMLHTITGKSIAKLVGLREPTKRKAARR